MTSPWLVRTERRARRVDGTAAIVAVTRPSAPDADVKAFADEHLAELSADRAGLAVSPLELVGFPEGDALLRCGTRADPPGDRLVAFYRRVRGMLQAIVVEGPLPVPALVAELLAWILDDDSLHLTVEEFRVIERVSGAPPAAFAARSRLVESADASPGQAVDAFSRTLAARGILMLDADAGGWALTDGHGAIIAPLVGSRHVAWLTAIATGDEASTPTLRSLVLGRRESTWSAMQEESGGLRVTSLAATTAADHAARWCFPGAPEEKVHRPGEPPLLALPGGAVRLGENLPGAGRVIEAVSVRFIRPAAGGLEQRELTWIRDEQGGLWRVDRHDGAAVALPAGVTSLIALLAEGLDTREEET